MIKNYSRGEIGTVKGIIGLVKEAADHMHSYHKMIGKTYKGDHYDELHKHARNLDHVVGVLTKDAESQAADERDLHEDSGEYREDGHHERETPHYTREGRHAEEEEHDERKSIDWDAINAALKPLAERLSFTDSALRQITGKN